MLSRVLSALCTFFSGLYLLACSPRLAVCSTDEPPGGVPWDDVKQRFDAAQRLVRSPALAPQVAAAHNSFILMWMRRCSEDRPPPGAT
jgi:hypothetical protein